MLSLAIPHEFDRRVVLSLLLLLTSLAASALTTISRAAEPETLNIWPVEPPGETKALPPEADRTKPEDRLIAGRRIIKLGNVSTPQIAIHRPAAEKANGAAVVICPGGGHHILAYDLEGSEVAEWLNTLGVTGIVLKYRVPAREKAPRWRAAVQDAQRAVSIVRANAAKWNLDPERIGICGFSAGGETAALTSLFGERTYKPVDEADKHSTRPNFSILVYPAGLVEDDLLQVRAYIKVTKDAPPMFFVHAFDDRVSVNNSLILAAALKQVGVKAEVHAFESGGHGYGLRRTDAPITRWPDLAAVWLKQLKLLETADN